ncbi:hypothetical protein ACJMK2_007258 [Sinanodonta woodiana]|uniref:Myeloid leukemia factor 1 n=1 Tax=Sinanodonta woodiana TaxID=1069815 RepID=A0ABD3VKI0_SINWO
MYGRSVFTELGEDPFFAAQRDQMRQMDEMFQNPYAGFGYVAAPANYGYGAVPAGYGYGAVPATFGYGAVPAGYGYGAVPANFTFGPAPARITDGRDTEQQYRDARNSQLAQFGMFDMFGNMGQRMQNIESNFETMRADPNAHCYTQSSFMSYSNAEQGKPPKVYQAMASTRTAPGGIKETRKAVRDSEKHLEKLAIGTHINDRARIIEKKKDTSTGDFQENQELVNLDEAEAPEFDREWQEKTQALNRNLDYGRRGERSRQPELHRGQERRALPSSEKPKDYRERE